MASASGPGVGGLGNQKLISPARIANSRRAEQAAAGCRSAHAFLDLMADLESPDDLRYLEGLLDATSLEEEEEETEEGEESVSAEETSQSAQLSRSRSSSTAPVKQPDSAPRDHEANGTSRPTMGT